MDAVAAEPLLEGKRKFVAFCDLDEHHQKLRVDEYESSVLTIMGAKGLSELDQGAMLHWIANDLGRQAKKLARSSKSGS